MLRRSLNAAIVALALVVVLPTLAVLERLVPGVGRRFARRAVLVVGGLCGIRFEARGTDRLQPGGSYVLVPNHQSPLDIPALFVADPSVRFVAAAELFANPVLRLAMDALGTVRVDRRDPATAVAQVTTAADGGTAFRLVVFAEGGLTAAHEVARYKSGAFVLAIDTGATVVPVAVHGSGAVLPKGGLLGVRPGRVTVELLEHRSTDGLTRADRKQLRNDTEAAVRAAVAAGP